jgi:hypothetical protein
MAQENVPQPEHFQRAPEWLAENPQTRPDVLEKLKDDANPYVASRAETKLKTTRSVAERADEMLIQGRFAEAGTLYNELVKGLEDLLGKQHPEVAAALHKLAAVLLSQGKNSEAAAVEQRSRLITDAHKEL